MVRVRAQLKRVHCMHVCTYQQWHVVVVAHRAVLAALRDMPAVAIHVGRVADVSIELAIRS